MDKSPIEKASSLFCSVFVLLLSGSACQHGSASQAQIIEQSRRQAPAWISSESQIAQASELVYVNKKDRVVDLPLGLAQAQESSIVNLQLIVRNRIMSLALAKGELPASEKTEIDAQLKNILRTRVGEKDIQDIYFERIAPADPQGLSMPDYYRIYMLMKIDESRLKSILKELQEKIGGAGNAKLAARIGSIDTKLPQ